MGLEHYDPEMSEYMGFHCYICGQDNRARLEDIILDRMPLCGKCKRPLVDVLDWEDVKSKAKAMLQDAFVEPEDLDDLEDIMKDEEEDDWV